MVGVLLVNDDGYRAEGILQLRGALIRHGHGVVVCAPSQNMSAMGHSVTFRNEIAFRVIEEKDGPIVVVEGTPVDALRMGIGMIERHEIACPFDKLGIVISGINKGTNVGLNTCCSGTVACAVEACLLGYRALAVSIVDPSDDVPKAINTWPFAEAAEHFVALVLRNFLQQTDATVADAWNVNYPNNALAYQPDGTYAPKNPVFCQMSVMRLYTHFEMRSMLDPRTGMRTGLFVPVETVWMSSRAKEHEAVAGHENTTLNDYTYCHVRGHVTIVKLSSR